MEDTRDHASNKSDVSYPSDNEDDYGDKDGFYDINPGYKNPAEEEKEEESEPEPKVSHPKINGSEAVIYDWLIHNTVQNTEISEEEKNKFLGIASKINNCMRRKIDCKNLTEEEQYYDKSYRNYLEKKKKSRKIKVTKITK